HSSRVSIGRGSTCVSGWQRLRAPLPKRRSQDEGRGIRLPRRGRRHLSAVDPRLSARLRGGGNAGGGASGLPPAHREVPAMRGVPGDLRGDRQDAEALETEGYSCRPRQGRRFFRQGALQRKGMKGLGRTATLSLTGLALFSLLFSLSAEQGLWPHL